MSALRSNRGAVLRECVEGRLSPDMALMRLMLQADEPAELEALLAEQSACPAVGAAAAERLAALSNLLAQHAEAWHTVRATAAAVRHEPNSAAGAPATIARLASAFDQAARTSPEASVALYSFGKPEQLDTATRELVEWLDSRGILALDRDVLDIGCGIGRLEISLHDRVRRIVGIDVSSQMVRIARDRCAGFTNVEIHRTSGLGLEQFAGESFDCALAVDTFPYLVLAGSDLAAHHAVEAARVLRPGGSLAILNFSYRHSAAEDCEDLRRLADSCGLRLVLGGERPFTRWDGAAFHLVRSR
jgi:ubiquinone/menaquinone biosynthesis C-methylase UbiE